MYKKIFNLIKDVLYPRNCPLCGVERPVGSPVDQIVCSDCRKKLVPLQGVFCQTCGAPLVSEKMICLQCRENKNNHSYTKSYSLYAYRGAVKELIFQYKFRGVRYLAPFIAEQLIRWYGTTFFQCPIIPAPSEPRNRRLRGWDPVELLAKELAKQTGGTVHPILKRKKSSSQKELNRDERRKNLADKISLNQNVPDNERIILLDDIWTTGATSEICSNVILESYNGVINVVTIARD